MPQSTPENPTINHKEKNPLDPQTVFSITHAEIKATGKTQCVEHKWKKLSENEVVCGCGTVRIINKDDKIWQELQ